MLRALFAVVVAVSSTSAHAVASYISEPLSVPVDSPIALAGLAAAIGLATLRILKNRSK